MFYQAQDYGFLLKSQEYKLDQFDQNVGLNNPFINTINQADNGNLLVGTGEGVGVFDGKTFEMYYTDDHLKLLNKNRNIIFKKKTRLAAGSISCFCTWRVVDSF